MKILCVKCKQATPNAVGSLYLAQANNGRLQVKSVCSKCGCTKCTFAKRKTIEGEGLGDELKKLGQAISRKTLSNVPRVWDDYMRETQGRKVVKVSVCRKPLSGVFQKAIKLIRQGNQAGKKMLKKPHDQMFHLFMNITMDNGDVWLVEKNQKINIKKQKRDDGQCNKVEAVLRPPVAAQDFLERGRRLHVKRYGKDEFFFRYTALKYNCQLFVQTILDANGHGDRFRDFVMQDTDDLKNDAIESLAQTATDLGGVFSWLKSDVLGLGYSDEDDYDDYDE